MKIKKITIFTLLTLLLITGCGNKDENVENTTSENKKETTQTFELTTMDDKPITITTKSKNWDIDGLDNKVVLVNFFGTWCPPCIAEIPHLNHIRSKLTKDFEILAVDLGPRSGGINPKEEVQGFIFQHNVKFPVVSGETAKELFAQVREHNPGGSIPFMVLFNKDGQYVKHYIGMQPEEMLLNDISTIIKKN